MIIFAVSVFIACVALFVFYLLNINKFLKRRSDEMNEKAKNKSLVDKLLELGFEIIIRKSHEKKFERVAVEIMLSKKIKYQSQDVGYIEIKSFGMANDFETALRIAVKRLEPLIKVEEV